MEDEIGGFPDEFVIVFVLCGDDDFDGFFAEFFADAIDTAFVEFGNIRIRRWILFAFFQNRQQVSNCFEERAVVFDFVFLRLEQHFREARLRAGVACRAFGRDAIEHGIAIAIDANFDDALGIAGFIAFAPEFFTTTTPEMRFARCYRALERFTICPGEGEHEAAADIADDHGNEPVIIPFYVVDFHGRIGMPRAAKASFNIGSRISPK